MRHFYFFLLLASTVNSQILDIPDTAFKAMLTTTICASAAETGALTMDVDLNNDGEIQVSEANSVLKLTISSPGTINSIEGIQGFTNLKTLAVNSMVTSPANVGILEGLSGLKRLTFGSIGIGEFNFSQLTELILFYAGSNPFVNIDLSPTKVSSLNINWCYALEYLNTKNGYVSLCNYGPDDGCWDWQPLSSHFKYLCRDEQDFNDIPCCYTPLPWGVDTTYCSFAPGGNYNTITGNITFACPTNPQVAQFVSINVFEGSEQHNIFTNLQGNYLYYMGTGNVTLAPDFQNPYYTVSPPYVVHNFTELGQELNVDFCITPNGVHRDLESVIIPIGAARPGFDASYKVRVHNKGTEPMSGTLTFNFDDTLLDFVSSTAGSVVDGGSISWPFNNIQPLAFSDYFVTLNVNAPTELPAVNNGDVLSFAAVASTTTTDATPADNTASLNQVVVGSFDPNDKLVHEGEEIHPNQTGNYLHYTIRFQNTGTYEAEKVIIDDFLNATLAANTVEVIDSSHPMHSTREGNKLQFFFDGINLPPASTDEPGSQGYVTFKVKPALPAPLGTVIENGAKIYFDFNFPIITNTTSTTVVPMLSVDQNNRSGFSIYPNPAFDNLTIESASEILSYEIRNIIGQRVFSGKQNVIDVSTLSPGTYLIFVRTLFGNSTRKLIKM